MTSNWLHRILRHTEAPPEGAWRNIANSFDEENTNQTDIKTKLQAYEMPPPVNAIENIFSRVDEETAAIPKFTGQIYNYTEEPPVTAWKNITTQLGNDSGKTIRLKKNTRVVYFRAAAAALVIIAASVWIISQQKTGKTGEQAAAAQQNRQVENPGTGKEKNTPPEESIQKKESPDKTLAYQPEKKIPGTDKTVVTLVPAYIPGNTTEELAVNPVAANKEKLQNSNGDTPMDISLMNTPNTYISITGPDGQTVKVSSKFSNLLNYLNEENPGMQENLDLIIKESAKWRATFAAWRNKMTNNEVAPSLSNFMDIVELSKVLEEKK